MTPEAILFGRRAFAACGLARRFTWTFIKRVEGATTLQQGCDDAVAIRLMTLRGYYSRAVAWLGTVEKLNDALDLQAVSVAARALFEIVVDLTLIRHASTDHPPEKIYDWERSAVLKQAERVQRYFQGKTVPAEYRGFPAMLAGAEPATIYAKRNAWWGGTHPPRWTNRSLEADALQADKLRPDAELREYYELNHAMLSWATHGSGLAGLRTNDPDHVPASCALRLVSVQRFGMLAAQLVLEELGLFLRVEFEDFRVEARRLLDQIAIDSSLPTGAAGPTK